MDSTTEQVGTTAVCTISVTTPTETIALELAEALVERSLVACAQVGGPITSVYRWQGELERSEEWTLTLKTVRARVETVLELVVSRHPFDVPEVLVSGVEGGSRAYLDWVAESCSGPG